MPKYHRAKEIPCCLLAVARFDRCYIFFEMDSDHQSEIQIGGKKNAGLIMELHEKEK